jgi:chitodextrinase
LLLTGADASGISLSWSASSDNVGVAGYELSLNGGKVGTTTATSYNFGGLACGTSYTLAVAAYDAAGNRSPQASMPAATSACPLAVGQAEASYYVSSSGGSDSNDGRTPATAWRSLAKLNSAPLAPGDTVRFAAGDSFAGLLSEAASGTGAAPITLASYGIGAQPLFTDASQPSTGDCVDIKGSYVVVDGLRIDACRYGLRLFGQHDEVRGSTFTQNAEGLRTEAGADYASVHDNTFSNNNRMVVNTPCSVNCNDDYGADAVLISGNNGDFAHNTVTGSWALSSDYGHDGAAFEVWGGSGNTFAYNLARDNASFIELGCRCSTRAANGNKINYNVITSALPFAVDGIDAHGNEGFGPTNGTTVYNNSIYLASPASEALRCGSCSAAMMKLRNNAARMTGSGSGFNLSGADEDYDLLSGASWSGSLGPHSRNADPLFVSATNLDTQVGSPARGAGTALGLTPDFVGVPVPTGGLPDIGAYEH